MSCTGWGTGTQGSRSRRQASWEQPARGQLQSTTTFAGALTGARAGRAPAIVQVSKMRPRRAERVGPSSWLSALCFSGMAPALEGLGAPGHRQAQRLLPPPGPAASGWRRAAGARWQGCCTAAPGRSPAGPGSTGAATWAPTQGGPGAGVGGLHTGRVSFIPLPQQGEEWCPGADAAAHRVKSKGLSPHPSLCLCTTVSLQASGHSRPVVWKAPLPMT